MPLRLDIKVRHRHETLGFSHECWRVLFNAHFGLQRKLLSRSDRVKSMDLHSKEPWMLISLYNGNIHVWNHNTQVIIIINKLGSLD